jgi:hypothetical protein
LAITTANQLFNDLRNTQLNDPDGTTWPVATLLTALNAAIAMIVLLRPDAAYKVATVAMIAGTRQQLPSDGLRLLKLPRNIKADGSVGRAISIVEMSDMDLIPDWHQANGGMVIHYMFDTRTPKQYYIYPAVPAGTQVDIEYSRNIPDITNSQLDDPLPLDPLYTQPLEELMMYKLLSGDSSEGDTGGTHLNTAFSILQVKANSENAVAPKTRTGA